jgi:hypothetical protein
MTLLELAPLLTHSGFRAACLKKVENLEVRQYFELRYDQASDAMRAVMREPILNKVSAFTGDPQFRHIIGQRTSTFSMREAMDRGYWVIADLDKGRLGEQALTLASLLFAVVKNALFSRERRSLFTIYADEIQNFAAIETGIETVLSEARKFGFSVTTANQFLDQYPVPMRAAILSVGTHVYFQLSAADAATVSQALDGGKFLAERLKNLAPRHFIVKAGAERWTEAVTLVVEERRVADRLALAPPPGDRRRLFWGRIYYWAVVVLLAVTGFFSIELSLAPFRLGWMTVRPACFVPRSCLWHFQPKLAAGSSCMRPGSPCQTTLKIGPHSGVSC